MAAPPVAPFRVRYGAGPFQLVRLAPGMTPADVKEAVAGAVGLAVGSFFIRDALGVSGFHAGLAGDWDAVLLPGQAPPAGGAAGPGEWRCAARRLLSCSPSRGPEGLAGCTRHSAGVIAVRSTFPSSLPFPSILRRRRRRRRRWGLD